MFTLDSAWDESKKIIGVCDDVKILRWSSDVVSMIANKADLEGFKGYLDICTAGCHCHQQDRRHHERGCGSQCVTLPREAELILAVNIDGCPALGFDQLFNFHLNGPGDNRREGGCEKSWQDLGANYSTYRDLLTPAKLVAFLQRPEDAGKTLIVYGFDSNNQVLRREENGVWLNGYRVPTIYGLAIPDDTAPFISRITGVFKDPTAGSVRLATTDSSGATGVNLAVYEPDETVPQYRRIKLNRCAKWVRIAYMRANPLFTSRFDHVPLRSRMAFLLGMQARKHYSDQQTGDAHAFEADAARLEIEAQLKIEPPTYMPIQVIDRNNPRDKYEYDIR